ncbi:hypothetical protein D3C85_1626130 [compost metagenome]
MTGSFRPDCREAGMATVRFLGWFLRVVLRDANRVSRGKAITLSSHDCGFPFPLIPAEAGTQ